MSAKFDPAAMSSMFDHPSWTGKTLEEFHLFPKLAAEIRVMIWKACLPGPRLVMMPKRIIDYLNDSCCRRGTGLILRMPKPMPLPISLSVCRESRFETLKQYHPIESERTTWISYINYEIDTLYLNNDNYGYKVEDRTLGYEKVQSLLIHHPNSIPYNFSLEGFVRENYPNLKKLALALIHFGNVNEEDISDPDLKAFPWYTQDMSRYFCCVDEQSEYSSHGLIAAGCRAHPFYKLTRNVDLHFLFPVAPPPLTQWLPQDSA